MHLTLNIITGLVLIALCGGLPVVAADQTAHVLASETDDRVAALYGLKAGRARTGTEG
jgi:hypothetical protein